MRVTIVAANTFEHDSRLRRAAMALADDGHDVTVVAFAGHDLPTRESLGGTSDRAASVDVRRIDLDRRISGVFRPLSDGPRATLARLIGIDPEATVLPPTPPKGPARLATSLIRRPVEILAVLRRTGPWANLVLEAAPRTDVFHAKALVALPVIRDAAKRSGGAFVYDVADLHTEAARLARMPEWFRRLVRRREGRWVREAAGLTAVSDGVADAAAEAFGVPRPTVVLNCPPAWHPDEELPVAPDLLRPAAGLPPERRVILYQGGLSVDRGIEELLRAMDSPGLRDLDVAAVFLGYGRLAGLLRSEAAARPGRVAVLDAVMPGRLLEWTTSADVAYVGQPPRTLNQRLNLANKLFESLMAGVPVVAAQGTEHCRLITSEGVGACADLDDPDALAATLAGILSRPTEERLRLRRLCRAAAMERYRWEVQQDGLVSLYRGLADRMHQGATVR